MDATSEALSGQRQAKSKTGPNSAAPSSILTLEVKSVADCPGHGVSGVLGDRLSSATAHVREARSFLPYVAQRDQDRAEKLEACGSWLLFNEYIESGAVRLASGIFCQQPLLCGFCASGRAARQVQALSDKIDHVCSQHVHLTPYMVTLTMRSQPELKPMIRDFWAAWSKMLQRGRNAKAGRCDSVLGLMAGGFLAGEAKRGKGGDWHYHAHGIFLADVDRYQPVWERLKREWAGVLGQSGASVQFQPVAREGTPHAIRECCKYASKWEPGAYADRWTAFQSLTRVRRVRTFGVLYGVHLPEEVTDDLSDMEAEEYIERAFRYGQTGYYEVKHAQRERAFDEFNEKGFSDDGL